MSIDTPDPPPRFGSTVLGMSRHTGATRTGVRFIMIPSSSL